MKKSNKFIIGNRVIDSKSTTYIIAEVGINHNGDVELAKKIIRSASEAKADAVKFQKRTIDKVYTEKYLADYRETPFGTTQRALKEGLEFNRDQYIELKNYSHNLGLDFIVSPWDEEAVDFICDIGVDCIKVASPCVHDISLLKHIKTKGLPVILSTGMSEEEQVDEAVEILKDLPLIIMHCVSIYPTPVEALNLNRIQTLSERYPFACAIGYSGHEMDNMASNVAVSMGVKVIEKHVTLSRDLWGSDQKVSLEPNELGELVTSIRLIESMLGCGNLQVLQAEISTMRKLQRKRKINLIFADMDGVITDGRVYTNDNDELELKGVNYKDLDSISALKRKGYEICLLTKEDSDINKKLINKINPNHYVTNCQDKYSSVVEICNNLGQEFENICYIGDSYSDIKLFKELEHTFCPNDAIPRIKDTAKYILNRKGGDGCLAEMIVLIENINRGVEIKR